MDNLNIEKNSCSLMFNYLNAICSKFASLKFSEGQLIPLIKVPDICTAGLLSYQLNR